MTEQYKLKQDDMVVMHTCMEHDSPDNLGKIWTCRSDEFKHKGHDYGSIFLDGFSGSFSTEFLQKVDLTEMQKTVSDLSTRLQFHDDHADSDHQAIERIIDEKVRLRKALEEAQRFISNVVSACQETEWIDYDKIITEGNKIFADIKALEEVES